MLRLFSLASSLFSFSVPGLLWIRMDKFSNVYYTFYRWHRLNTVNPIELMEGFCFNSTSSSSFSARLQEAKNIQKIIIDLVGIVTRHKHTHTHTLCVCVLPSVQVKKCKIPFFPVQILVLFFSKNFQTWNRHEFLAALFHGVRLPRFSTVLFDFNFLLIISCVPKAYSHSHTNEIEKGRLHPLPSFFLLPFFRLVSVLLFHLAGLACDTRTERMRRNTPNKLR